MSQRAILAFADGSIFSGTSFSVDGTVCGELVFNTAMTGYQEILSDPSYANQIVTFTYPHIGNVGCNDFDMEADKTHVKGMICRNLPTSASSWRSESNFASYMKSQALMAAAGFDTRHIVKRLREEGAMNVCLTTEGSEKDAILAAQNFKGLVNVNLAKDVTTASTYQCQSLTEDKKIKTVVAYDFGIKQSILRHLQAAGFKVIVVPYSTSVEQVLSFQPDGIFLSNGPGDPSACTDMIEKIQYFINEDMPLFGICLGFQLLALALGGRSYKMKFGHHGANHPVKAFFHAQSVLISSQNHGFAIDESTLPANCVVTHRSLFDDSLQGFKMKSLMGFQGHPEGGPGPNDVAYLFNEFYGLCA